MSYECVIPIEIGTESYQGFILGKAVSGNIAMILGVSLVALALLGLITLIYFSYIYWRYE